MHPVEQIVEFIHSKGYKCYGEKFRDDKGEELQMLSMSIPCGDETIFLEMDPQESTAHLHFAYWHEAFPFKHLEDAVELLGEILDCKRCVLNSYKEEIGPKTLILTNLEKVEDLNHEYVEEKYGKGRIVTLTYADPERNRTINT
ncbi:MAG: hypothetical protein IKH92_07170 [Clostridiales bacterium]|nr:hypothetical protein [Clostridiales bacterium]